MAAVTSLGRLVTIAAAFPLSALAAPGILADEPVDPAWSSTSPCPAAVTARRSARRPPIAWSSPAVRAPSRW